MRVRFYCAFASAHVVSVLEAANEHPIDPRPRPCRRSRHSFNALRIAGAGRCQGAQRGAAEGGHAAGPVGAAVGGVVGGVTGGVVGGVRGVVGAPYYHHHHHYYHHHHHY